MCKRYPGGKRPVFSKGDVETVACNSLEDLRQTLSGIEANQVLITGYVTGTKPGDVNSIGTKDDCRHGEIPRIKSKFTQSNIFLIDYDHCTEFPCRRAAEVHAYMVKLIPEVFEGAGYLAKKSSSSNVLKNGKANKDASWHLYYMATDPFKLKFLADNLMKEAEASGLAYQKQASDGKTLQRTVVDLMPLKIGACGLVYEAPPIVDGSEYTLADSRMRIVSGDYARTGALQPIPKVKKQQQKKPAVNVASNGYWNKARKLHYSEAYRNLTLKQAAVLDDICMECRGINHGTPENPITMARSRFRVDHRKITQCLDELAGAGFIRYISGAAMRKPNQFFLNYEMLFMNVPKGWKWDT